jgi:UDP-N-acetylglucosamine--N-acetylmuramyl-(pentapeptide) pyrophosphoryl-undecaprenol N-acetylglucosamine transferase
MNAPGPGATGRVFIACGGTGGHLAPGIALGEALRAQGHAVTLLISHKQIDARLVAKYSDFTVEKIPAAPFLWRPGGLWRCLRSQWRGFGLAWRRIGAERPSLIVGFGGFTTAAVIVAGAMRGVPVVLHEANHVPGRAIRWLTPLAQRLYLPPGVAAPWGGRKIARPVGLPVRAEIQLRPPAAARRALGLRPEGLVLVVLGGSQGAGSLNAWARTQAARLAERGGQLYCVTGPAAETAPTGPGVFSLFCDRMADLFSAADLVVSRAGAGTLAELTRCTTPAVLVPYPHAADNHQAANAAWWTAQGGGVVVPESRFGELTATVDALLDDEPRRREMIAALARLDRESALATIMADIARWLPVAGEGGGKGARA